MLCQPWFHYWIGVISWWRHQMETFSALLALCAGNSPVPVNSQHKGQWRGTLMFSLICAWINDWVNNRQAGDLRRHCGHYDVNVMWGISYCLNQCWAIRLSPHGVIRPQWPSWLHWFWQNCYHRHRYGLSSPERVARKTSLRLSSLTQGYAGVSAWAMQCQFGRNHHQVCLSNIFDESKSLITFPDTFIEQRYKSPAYTTWGVSWQIACSFHVILQDWVLSYSSLYFSEDI